jgi:small-conductance mechanosensitive channel
MAMKYTDVLWAVIGLLALGLGVAEIVLGKYLLGLSALVIGGVLLATVVPALLKNLTFRGFRPR